MELHKGSVYRDKSGNCFEYLGTNMTYGEFTLVFRTEFGHKTYRLPENVRQWFDE